MVSLPDKAKAAQTNKAKEGIQVMFPSAARCFATSRKAGLNMHSNVLRRWTPSLWTSSASSFPVPHFNCWVTRHVVWNIPLASLGMLSWFCSHPSCLYTPSALTGRTAWEAEKSLALCKNCSTAAETLLYYPHFVSQIQGTSSWMFVYYSYFRRKFYPSPNWDTWHNKKSVCSSAWIKTVFNILLLSIFINSPAEGIVFTSL